MSLATKLLGLIASGGLVFSALAQEPITEPVTQVIKEVKPFRTFITIQKYNLENSGKSADKTFNARIELSFPNGSTVTLPEGGHRWPIGNGQSQEINRTFEVPWSLVQSDSTKFTVAILRSGSTIAPCEFSAEQLSQFNRGYVCHTDAGIQADQGTPQDKIIRESVFVRVFTDRNSNPTEVPKDAIALRN
jgi:hypothetical protein